MTVRDDAYEDMLREKQEWIRQQMFNAIYFNPLAVPFLREDVVPLQYEELITHSDALWASEIGVRLD